MADDVILIEYRAKIDKLETDLHKLETDLRGVEASSKKTMNTLENESNQAAAAVKKVDKDVSGLGTRLKDLSGQIPGAASVQQILSIGTAMQGAATATTGASTAMKVLKIAMASTGIGALVVAFGSLVAYFTQTEAGGDRLAKIMRVVGAVVQDVVKVFANIGETLADFFVSTENAAKATDDYKKSTIELAEEVADLDDLIEGLSITVSINNDILQTGIERNLRALRNRNITLDESIKLIKENGDAEKQQLANANSVLDKKLELEKKEFTLKVKNSDVLSEEELKKTKETLASINTVVGFREWQLKREIEAHNVGVAQLKEQTVLFDKFVNHEISAETLLDKAKGVYTADDLKRVSEIVLAREAAIRNQSNAEEKLQNNLDAALDKDKARREKEQADKLKADQDEKKRLDDLLKAKLDAAKREATANESLAKQRFVDGVISEGALQSQLEKIQIDSLNKQKKIFLDFKKDVSEIDKQLVDIQVKNKQEQIKEESEADYKFYQQHSKDIKDKVDSDLKEESDFYDALSVKAKEQRDKELKEFKELQAQKKQILTESINVAATLLNSINQTQLANATSEIQSEQYKNDQVTASLLTSLEKRNEQGLLSEQSYASKKAAIQKEHDKKDADLKKKQFDAQKKADLTSVLINTAVSIAKTFATYGFTPAAVIAAAAAASEGAIQYAAVSSKQAPKFKDGVIDYKGIGTGTSDENHVMISNRESIITAKATRKHRGLLEAVNGDFVDNYLTNDYLKPMIDKQNKAYDKEKRKLEEALFMAVNKETDVSHLERLTKKNGSVSIKNVSELAKYIGMELKANHNPNAK